VRVHGSRARHFFFPVQTYTKMTKKNSLRNGHGVGHGD
jgi:hypothetical protein